MKRSRAWESTATPAGACIIGASLTGFAAPDAAETNAAYAVAAIHDVVSESLSGLAAISSDSDTAAEVALPGGTVDVPIDPADGLRLGESLRIGFPFAQEASDAADSPLPGVVAFDNNNGSTTVPVALSDGTVQINTVIDNANAPERYDYPIDVPDGASLAQEENGNGSNYWIAPGALLGTCKGSYLKKYINGTMVQSVPLTGYGKPGNPAAFGRWECLVSVAWAGFSIYGPGKFVRFASGAFGYVLAQAIPTNITMCRA